MLAGALQSVSDADREAPLPSPYFRFARRAARTGLDPSFRQLAEWERGRSSLLDIPVDAGPPSRKGGTRRTAEVSNLSVNGSHAFF